jgi:hypothetical protein
MSADGWNLLYTALIVIAQAIAFKRYFWDMPLKNGLEFFFGIEVPQGFYEGVGARWLRAWHALVLSVNLILALALAAILFWGPWDLLAVWAGGVAVLHVATFMGFRLYARAKLGKNPPIKASAAVSLEPRRLGDYFWWPGEAIMASIIALSWVLLCARGDARLRWPAPVTLTYLIVGLFLLEIGFVRMSFPPLPADRPEEHRRWMEASMRWSVRVWDISRWLFATVLAAYALEHGWHAVAANPWSRQLLIGIALAVWVSLVVSLLRGERRLTLMGRGLRPAGSWSTPFRTAEVVPRSLAVLFFAWFGGLILLIAVSLS